MKKVPVVSVIIPVYNNIKTLHRPLESLLKQSLKDIEIIIVDDCSVDDSVKWAEDFLAKKKVSYKLLTLDRHRGVSAARNLGMEKAVGECLLFLDADDYLESTCLEKLYSLFRKNRHVDVGFCGFRRVNVTGKIIQSYLPKKKYLSEAVPGKEAILLFWKKKIDLHMTSCMVRRSFLMEERITFHEGCIYREDFEFHSKILISARSVASVPEELSCYVVDEHSTTGKKDFLKRAAIHELAVFLRLRKIIGNEERKASRLLDLYVLHGYIEILEQAWEEQNFRKYNLLIKSQMVQKALALSWRNDILLSKPEYLGRVLRVLFFSTTLVQNKFSRKLKSPQGL